MRATTTLWLTLLLGPTIPAQTQPDATEILRKVTETYQDVAQYELEFTTDLRDATTGQAESSSLRIVFKAPGKYRQESADGTIVYDSPKMLVYNRKSNEYSEYTAPKLPRESRPEDVDLLGGGIGVYRHALEGFGASRFVREDNIAIAGAQFQCFVIEVTTRGASGKSLIWIDKKNYHVLRTEGSAPEVGTITVEYKTVKLGDPLSDDLFKFELPQNARKRDP